MDAIMSKHYFQNINIISNCYSHFIMVCHFTYIQLQFSLDLMLT